MIMSIVTVSLKRNYFRNYFDIRHMNSMKRQKDRKLNDKLSRSIGAPYTTGDQWRNNSRKNEETEPKEKTVPSCGCDVMERKSNAVKNNIA